MFVNDAIGSNDHYDAVLVGAGVMSSTLAVLLHELDPQMRLLIVERLEAPGLESSFCLNNAGTGHAGNCELNYTPLNSDGTLAIDKALEINRAFEQSLEFWASLTELGKLSPKKFLNYLPHISFVYGENDVAFLRKRYEKLIVCEAFREMEWSSDKKELKEWMPLIFEGRKNSDLIAATKIKRGTDLDFGSLTSNYLENLYDTNSIKIKFSTEVVALRRYKNESWLIDIQSKTESKSVNTPFVFIGGGGRSLTLLQKSLIEEGLCYGGFPVSGKWLICNENSITNKHNAKVYGKAALGAPPMSVPHLDTRWIEGKRCLLFGPFAGFSTKFLKKGSNFDLFGSVKSNNIFPLVQAGLKNIHLVQYLIDQLLLDHNDRLDVLRNFVPNAKENEWKLFEAGQRVQIIKASKRGGILKMGTELVTSSDGSLAALLGASPGASTAVTTMLEVLNRCWKKQMATETWKERLITLFPSLSKTIHKDLFLLKKIRERNDSILGFSKDF